MGGTEWRVTPLPPGWKRIRLEVLRRDGYQCTWLRVDTEQRCAERKRLEVDHVGERDDHSLSNLRVLCHYHHARVTHAQSQASRTFARKQRERELSPFEQRARNA